MRPTPIHPVAADGGWFPTSACGPGCGTEPTPRLGPLDAVSAVARAVAVLGLVIVGGLAVLGPARMCAPVVAGCLRRLLRAAGVQLTVTDAAGVAGGLRWPSGALVVANHLSWIDVAVLCSIRSGSIRSGAGGSAAGGRVRMMAKSEVRSWPVIGLAAARCGSLFVDRAGLRRLPDTVAATAVALRGGDTVVVFPEGTTWCGRAAGSFRPAPFQAALDADAPVVPVALRLCRPDGRPWPAAAFVGEESLAASLRRTIVWAAAGTPVQCVLTVLDPIAPAGDRRRLAAAAARAVGGRTGVVHPPRPAPVRSVAAVA